MSIKLNGTTLAGTPKLYSDKGQSTTGAMTQKACTDSFLNTNQITNCITEIPQDIKLEIINDNLVAKAGTKVYYPDGFETDGTTRKFSYIVLENDFTFASTATSGDTYITGLTTDGTSKYRTPNTNCFSGDTAPESPTDLAIWYDTTNNIIKRYVSSAWVSGWTFPIGITTWTEDASSHKCSSIDQVFNGFGYIGSTVFALPGVKGLAPNGRNADGSLKNNEIILNNIMLWNTPDNWDYYAGIMVGQTSNNTIIHANYYYEQKNKPTFISNHNNYWYNPETNLLYYYRTDNNQGYKNDIVMAGYIHNSSTAKFSDLNIKTSFHAVDYNDTEYIGHQAMPSNNYIDLTLGASGTSYTAPADGYFCISKLAGGEYNYMTLSNLTSNLHTSNDAGGSSHNLIMFILAKKNDNVKAIYNASGTTNFFRFIYAEGSK